MVTGQNIIWAYLTYLFTLNRLVWPHLLTVPRDDAAVALLQDNISVCPKINGRSYITMETLIPEALAPLTSHAVSETVLWRFIFVSYLQTGGHQRQLATQSLASVRGTFFNVQTSTSNEQNVVLNHNTLANNGANDCVHWQGLSNPQRMTTQLGDSMVNLSSLFAFRLLDHTRYENLRHIHRTLPAQHPKKKPVGKNVQENTMLFNGKTPTNIHVSPIQSVLNPINFGWHYYGLMTVTVYFALHYTVR